MKVVGLITEYNPFHNGHLFHLQQSLEQAAADYSVAVMSGHFLQRGEPALLDKWARAAMAVKAGVDLVIELPYVFSCRSAYAFARGAVDLLSSCGIVSHLCFGSEKGDLRPLIALADIFAAEPPRLQSLIKKFLKQGYVLPLAQTKALQEYCMKDPLAAELVEVLNNPNNILGIEYLRNLKDTGSIIIPLTIKRTTAGYHDTQFKDSIASATSIRDYLTNHSVDDLAKLNLVVPPSTLGILRKKANQGEGPVFAENFLSLLRYKIVTATADELADLMDVNEGLENRILSQIKRSHTFKELVENIKTKRYTWTRIQRVLNYIIMNFSRQDAELFDRIGPKYIRVLASTKKGRHLLALMRKRAELPVVTRVAPFYKKADSLIQKMLEYDLKASDIYTIGYKNPALFGMNKDFLTGPYLLD